MDDITQVRFVNAVTSVLLVLNIFINLNVALTWKRHFFIIVMITCPVIGMILQFAAQITGLKTTAGIVIFELAMPPLAFGSMACGYSLMQFFELTVVFAPKWIKTIVRINTFLSILTAIWNQVMGGCFNFLSNYQGQPKGDWPNLVLYSKCLLMVH